MSAAEFQAFCWAIRHNGCRASLFQKGDIKFPSCAKTAENVDNRPNRARAERKKYDMSIANREYKNSVFKNLFHDEKRALELYNALTDNRFTADDGLCFTTLENVLFMDRSNDISFTIGGKLVVCIEHQAGINKNMPLRALIYIARVYEKIIDNKAIYRTNLFMIPTPEFYVLYNGKAAYPDEATLRLSDAFRYVNLAVAEKLPPLELIVRVLNVNVGHNEKILKKCESLRGYAVFTGKIREYQRAGQSLDDAIVAAIDYCIANGILMEYLKKNGSEVRNMLFTEFKMEEAQQVWLEEGREEKGFEIARAMFADGDSLEKIARNTGMPLDTLKEKLLVQ